MMSAVNVKTIRNVREPLKKPRPLKATLSATEPLKSPVPEPKDTVTQKSKDAIFDDLEILNVSLSNCNYDAVTVADISRMCTILKKRGEELDAVNKEAMDCYFCTLRNTSREERLDIYSRLKILETIEYRARNWRKNENIDDYFKGKFLELEANANTDGLNHSPSLSNMPNVASNNQVTSPTIPLQHGEILRSSGKFTKPTKIAGKNYFKDEIVIRNSDSGKVMGIKGRRVHMIEELSDTVISFQRVNPGARDRLVQITGPHEESISNAKILVEDTIRRNASPLRENTESAGFENKDPGDTRVSYSPVDNQAYLKRNIQHSFSMSDASVKEYNSSVRIGKEIITLSGTNADLIKTASSVLKEYFLGQGDSINKVPIGHRVASPENTSRYELKRQSSLRSNMERNFTINWTNNNNRNDSVSTLSSSEDEVLQDTENIRNSTRNSSFTTIGNNLSMSTDMSSFEEKISTSSLSNAMLNSPTYSDIQVAVRDEVFSPLLCSTNVEIEPPIPPPSYKKTYSRDFLLSCAKSPHSHIQPEDFPFIYQNFMDIIRQAPVMFDPDTFESVKPTTE